MMEKKARWIFSIGLILIFLFGFLFYTAYVTFEDLEEKNEILGVLLSAESKYLKSTDSQMSANDYYDLASENYFLDEFSDVGTNCRLSRDYSQKHIREIRMIISTLSDYKEEKVVSIYSSMLSEIMNAYIKLDEICESLELAAEQYEEGDYFNAGENIDDVNEKIKEHGISIDNYNFMIDEYDAEITKFIS